MKTTLAIDITSKQLNMALLVPTTTGSVWSRAFKALTGTTALQKTHSVQIVGEVAAHNVQSRLQQALDALRKRSLHPIAKANVSVRLGADFAKVAVMDDPRASGLGLSITALDSHVRTWMDWNWGVAAQGVARHTPLPPDKLLISLVEPELLAALEQFCKESNLQLVECRPAIVSHIEVKPVEQGPENLTVNAVLEVNDGHTAPVVQFIATRQGLLLSIHRMFLPNASENVLRGIAQRLLASHELNSAREGDESQKDPGSVSLTITHWPSRPDGVTGG